MIIYAPTAIDLSRSQLPSAIEKLDFEVLYQQFVTRFLAHWTAARVKDPSLPQYNVEKLDFDPTGIAAQAWSDVRLLDIQRINDKLKALFAPYSWGSNLEALVAGRNLQRLVIIPADGDVAAIMESDAALLRRYLLSFDVPAAGSTGRYLFDAWTAWPQNDDRSLGLWDARVNGYKVHGVRGRTDVVLIGPFGRLPTSSELAAVRARVKDVNRAPEAVDIDVGAATRDEYTQHLVLEVPGHGPSPDVIKAEAETRVRAAALGRTLLGGEVPAGLLAGSAYGSNIIRVRDASNIAIAANAYRVPVMTGLNIEIEVRQ